jgi:hypothetical protein
MDFQDQIIALSEKVARMKDQVTTEEATKTAFVMPFINALGFDIFNPMEVVPEFIADLGIKKGEKVDYCIHKDGHPIIIIECKPWTEKLDPHNSQLFRYFHVTTTRFAVLTNGINYRFYTDLEEANKMDEKPFMELNMLDLREHLILQLKKFHKSAFDVDNILSTASELKYSRELRNLISQTFSEPPEAIVKHFVSQTYTGRLTPKVMEQFQPLVKHAFNQFLSDAVTDRLKSALSAEAGEVQMKVPVMPLASIEIESEPSSKVNTTNEEMEAFYIVKSILHPTVKASRIGFKDTQSYFAVQLDNTIRKQVCRFYFTNKKSVVIIDNKEEVRYPLNNLEGLYDLADKLKDAAMSLVGAPA